MKRPHIQGNAKAQDAEEANHWRRADFFIRSIVLELEMWIWIHKNKGAEAWTSFVAAEGYARRAAGWLPDFVLAQERVQHLAEVERVIFPHQPFFVSSGMILADETSTLCGAEYGTCEHLAGEIYNGTVAWRRGEQIKDVLHVALVPSPSDKNCRITGTNGGIDPLTGEPSERLRAPRSQRNGKRKKKRKRYVAPTAAPAL